MATYNTKSGSFTYSGNPDFRGYLASNAPEFLPYVGAGPSGNTYQDYGVNMSALKKKGGIESNYAQQSLTPEGAAKVINQLYGRYSSMSTAPQIDSANTGGGGGGYGYGYGKAVDPLAETYAGQRNDTRTRLQSAIDAYNNLFGRLQNVYSEQVNTLKKGYGEQRNKLQNTYQDTANKLTGAYQAKGLGDSSFAANAQNSATNNYQTDLSTIGTNEQKSMSDAGAKYNTARAQYESAKSGYQDYLNRIGSFGGSELNSIINSAQLGLQSAAQAQAGTGTQAENIQAIQNIAPVQMDASQIQTQLQNLQNSGTTDSVKNAIAKGYITQVAGGNKDQESYWTDYYNTLKTTGKV